MKKTSKVLLIIPFESIYPPTSGGKQRCFNILHQLSIHFDLTVLSDIDQIQIESAKRKYINLRTVNFLTTEKEIKAPYILRLLPQRISNAIYYRYLSRTLLNSTQSFLIKFCNPTLRILKECSFDFVIHENLDSLDLARIIKRKFPQIVQVYDAYNFDSEIAKHQFNLGLITKRTLHRIQLTESKLFNYIDILWTCSQRESELFSEVNFGGINKIDVIANGTEISQLQNRVLVNQRPELLFVGSLDYFPNEEGLLWFLINVLPRIKADILLKIIGSGTASDELNQLIALNKNVKMIGFVDEIDEYYANADIIIIPIISGSGTRLKALEAMQFQKAIVSTRKGVEGIEIIDEVIIEDQPEEMAIAISTIIQNVHKKNDLGRKARQLVEKSFDWNVIGYDINNSLKNYIQQ